MSDDFDSLSTGDFDSDFELDEYEEPKQWRMTQMFRKLDEEVDETIHSDDYDHISSLEFDETGEFLATGDKSGNVVVLCNDGPGKHGAPAHFTFFAEFASHIPDFDYVKAKSVYPNINQIKFGPRTNDSLFLLTSNDRDIKLWRIQDREAYTLVDWNIHPSQVTDDPPPTVVSRKQTMKRCSGNFGSLKKNQKQTIKLTVPRKVVTEVVKVSSLRKTYAPNIHKYPITKLSISSDKEHFFSADDLNVHLWDFNVPGKAYNTLNIEPEDIANLSEVICSIDCHPLQSHLFLYSTSVGNILSCDLRQKALVDEPAQVFSPNNFGSGDLPKVEDDPEGDMASFFDEITQKVSAAKFSKGGKYIIARDYMSIKIWDVAMERQPVETIYVHEYLRAKVWDVYSSDLYLDGFDVGISPNGNVVTGTYSNYFHIMDFGENRDLFIQAGNPSFKSTNLNRSKIRKEGNFSRNAEKERPVKKSFLGAMKSSVFGGKRKKADTSFITEEGHDYPYNMTYDKIDFTQKVLNTAWHPDTDTVAVTAENNLYLYGKSSTRTY